jgi:SAM-dependent methyltransferase
MSSHHQRILKPHLPLNPDSAVLDVGCGMGFALESLRQLGYRHLEGFDTDNNQVALAQKGGLPVVWAENPLSFLAERAGSKDLILCLDVLEHVPKTGQLAFASAIRQALKPGGRLILTVPNASAALASRWRYIDWTHETSFTEHSIDFLLFNSGFSKISVFASEFGVRPKWIFLPRKSTFLWALFQFYRLWRRGEMIAELGPEQGRAIPLSLNLLVVADRN